MGATGTIASGSSEKPEGYTKEGEKNPCLAGRCDAQRGRQQARLPQRQRSPFVRAAGSQRRRCGHLPRNVQGGGYKPKGAKPRCNPKQCPRKFDLSHRS